MSKLFRFKSLVPRPGLEPGWVAPLVFETSASTDSAIWASSVFENRLQRYEKYLKYKTNR